MEHLHHTPEEAYPNPVESLMVALDELKHGANRTDMELEDCIRELENLDEQLIKVGGLLATHPNDAGLLRAREEFIQLSNLYHTIRRTLEIKSIEDAETIDAATLAAQKINSLHGGNS